MLCAIISSSVEFSSGKGGILGIAARIAVALSFSLLEHDIGVITSDLFFSTRIFFILKISIRRMSSPPNVLQHAEHTDVTGGVVLPS